MARTPSVIMTVQEKKLAITGLKTAISTHKAAQKVHVDEYNVAGRSLADAKRAQTKAAADAAKAVAVATKAEAKAKAKLDKMLAAAAKGEAKLQAQMSTLVAAPVVKPVATPRASKKSVSVPQMNGAVNAPASATVQ